MTDDPQNVSSASDATVPAGPSDQKSPLDVLEELLKDSQAGAQAPQTVPPSEATSPAAPPPEPAGPSREELAQMEAERAAQDQAAAQAKITEIQSVQTTPEYQVRVQQDQAVQQQQAEQTTAQEGFEITQLDHTKIP